MCYTNRERHVCRRLWCRMESLSFPSRSEAGITSDTLQILHHILSASDIEIVWSLCTGYFRDLGLAHVIYGYSPDSTGLAMGPVEDMLLFSTMDHGFLRELLGARHFTRSVTFNWAIANVGIASFSMAAEGADDPDRVYPPQTLAFFARYGVETGFSIGFPPVRARDRGVMTVLGPPDRGQDWVDALLQSRGKEIQVVATVAHRMMAVLPNPGNRRLTDRQREVLEWLAQGKSSVDVACIMSLSLATVEKHLRHAREALGVETTAHALVKAAFLNQMFLLPRAHP